jgi:hypothetical protein
MANIANKSENAVGQIEIFKRSPLFLLSRIRLLRQRPFGPLKEIDNSNQNFRLQLRDRVFVRLDCFYRKKLL